MQHQTSNLCPRCKTDIMCKVGNVSACQCFEVELSANTKKYLSKIPNYSCFCKNCLQKIEEMVQLAEKLPFPQKKGEFIEGLHYYRDGIFWVFKEFYHIQRGYCCENNCKHCAYGKNY